MFKKEHLNDGALRKLVVEIPKGQFLFRQNDKGNTMYLIVDGSIELRHKVLQAERVVGVVGPGQVVGERAICISTPYKRTASALALTDATVLEFDSNSLKAIQTRLPDFSLKLLALVSDRLERSNELISILQIPESVERVLQWLVFACEYLAKPVSGGKELDLVPETIQHSVNVGTDVVKQVIDELVHEKILVQRDGKYILANESALLQSLPTIKERIAA